jgi:lambda family phage tail tape measure protein
MSDYEADLGRLDVQLAGLEGTIAGLEGVTGSFRRELDGMQGSMKDAGREATGMSRSVSSSVRQAFEGMIFDGKRLSETLAGVGRNISGAVLSKALAPVQNALGSALGGLLPFADGGVVSGGRVAAFARGGVVDGPTHFPMRGGVGLMGEAGPEAILPLARSADGRLGIRGEGGGGAVNVTMNISTPDAAGFRKSQSQIAADMNRAIARGRRNL